MSDQGISTARTPISSLLNVDAFVSVCECYEFTYDVLLQLGEIVVVRYGGESKTLTWGQGWFPAQDRLRSFGLKSALCLLVSSFAV